MYASDGLQNLFAAGAKLRLISDVKTSLLMGDLLFAYGEIFIKLLVKVMPIRNVFEEINFRKEHYDLAQSEISRILLTMTKINESAQPNNSVFKALSDSYRTQQDQAIKIAVERDALWHEHNSLQAAFSKDLLADLKLIEERQLPVMIEIRREMDIESDGVAFEQQATFQRKRMDDLLDALLSSLRKD